MEKSSSMIISWFLAINDIEHTKTKAQSPQTNGICERFHKTILNEFYQITFRKKIYGSLEELQRDLGVWLIDKFLVKKIKNLHIVAIDFVAIYLAGSSEKNFISPAYASAFPLCC